MEKSSGLGRGLSSLIPIKKNKPISLVSANGKEELAEILEDKESLWLIPVDKINPNPHQPRKNFEAEELDGLAQSIKEHGIIQPLILTKAGQDDWQVIAGERRLRAAKLAGLKTVPAIVRALDEQRKLETALIENLQRKDLNVLEVALAYKKLIDDFNLDYDELAQRVGKSRSTVSNTLRLLSVEEEVKQAIWDGKIFEGHARVLAGLPAEDQLPLLNKILNEKLNIRETEKSGREVVVKKHIRRLPFDPEVRAKEETLEKVLDTKVEIKKFGPSGQIIIKFFSDEELEDIYRKIT